MAIRWGAPALAAGLLALAGTHVRGAYFGVTNYSTDAAPVCCAQTHFMSACADAEFAPPGVTAVVAASENGVAAPSASPAAPQVELSRMPGGGTTAPTVEVAGMKVRETVMKDCRTTVYDTVCETHYKEFTYTRRQRVCDTVVEPQRFLISKPVCETIFEERKKTVCKPVCETQYRECTEKVCTPVTETIVKETCRQELREVTEIECREVKKVVEETVTCMKTVKHCVPERVCEKVCVPARIAWQHLPRYECVFDPCTCTTVQKQVGTVRKLVREPAHETTREVIRTKTVVETVPETRVVKKTVVEKVPTPVVKKVPITVYDKVPVTVTRNVPTIRTVKVPVTVTKMVPTVEVTQVPVLVRRKALGTYVDATALKPEAAAALGKGREFAVGGASALREAGVPVYDCAGPGRVFVEGLMGTRTVTHTVTRTVPVTHVCRIPYPVFRMVPRVVMKKMPVTVMRTVPIPAATCATAPACQSPACSQPCAGIAPTIICEGERGRSGPTVGNCGKFGPSRYPYGCLDDPNRPHPLQEFFHRLFSGRAKCAPCTNSPCATMVPPQPPAAPVPAAPTVTPPVIPKSSSDRPVETPEDKAVGAPGTLPSIPPLTLPPIAPQ